MQRFDFTGAHAGQDQLLIDLNQHHLVFETQRQSLKHLDATVGLQMAAQPFVALDPPQSATQQQEHAERACNELDPIETLHDEFPVRNDGFLTHGVPV